MTTSFILANIKGKPFVLAGSPRMQGGQPVQRFQKELIRVGQYVKASDGIEFEVTPATLEHWVATFSRMADAGVKVPVPVGHTNDPERNRGWVVDMFVSGDALVGVVDLVGDDAIQLAGRSDVSIFSPAGFVDGSGNEYARPIMHVAICTDPVIPGLGEWVPIAASRVPILTLNGVNTMEELPPELTPAPVPEPAPAPKKDNPSDSIRNSFKQAVNSVLDDTKLDEAGMIAKIKNILKAMGKALGLMEADEPGEPTAIAASADPMLVTLATENYQMKLAGLVSAGKITPAVRLNLEKSFLGDVLALSLSAKQESPLGAVLNALAENSPSVAFGEKTGKQTLALTNEVPVGGPMESMKKDLGLS